MEKNGPTLRSIIKKLDHDLLEVRKRALYNISSKLSNNIIVNEDLVHEQKLFENLFKLLNRKEEEIKVLSLLQILSKHSEGVTKIIKLGGIDFLTLFQHDTKDNEELSNAIHSVLNNLYRKSIHESQNSDNNTIEKLETTKVNYEMEKLFTEYDKHNVNNSNPTVHEIVNITEDSKTSSMATSIVNKSILGTGHFHWISLTSSDRQVLSVTHKRLQSESPQLILQSCKFFRDVLLHDFPTEVFVQRPGICEAILHSIGVYQYTRKDLVVELLTSLYDICKTLHKRCMQYENKSTIHCKEENIHTASMSTNMTESSSLSGESAPSKYSYGENTSFQNVNQVEDGDFECSMMTEALLQTQKPTEDICLCIFSTCLDIFDIHFDDNLMFISAIKISISVLKLLKFHSFILRWENPDPEDNKFIYHLITNIHKFDVIGEKIMKKLNGHINETDYETLILKRISIGRIVLKLLKYTVPEARIYEVVTDDLVLFLQSLLLSSSVEETLPKLRQSLENFIAVADEPFKIQYEQVKNLLAAMSLVDDFFKSIKDKKHASIESFIDLCYNIYPSLGYYVNGEFICNLIEFVSSRYVNCKCKSKLEKLLKDAFSYVNSHGLNLLVKEMYDKVEMALTESLVTNPLSIKHQASLIIFNENVFSEVIGTSLLHDDITMREITEKLLTLLLKSSLNMSSKMWKDIMSIISNHICFIQIAASNGNVERTYSKTVFSMYSYPSAVMDVEGKSSGLLQVDVIKCLFRQLFCNVKRLRLQAVGLTILMNNDYCKKENIPLCRRLICEDDKKRCCDMYCASKDRVSFSNNVSHSPSSGNIMKLYTVLIDEKISMSLRHAAAEQLAILYQDKSVQKLLMEKQPYQFCLQYISQHLKEEERNEETVDFITNLLTILSRICYHQPAVRNILSLQENIFQDVFLLSLQYLQNAHILNGIKCFLFLLLFNDVLDDKSYLDVSVATVLSASFCCPVDLPVKKKEKSILQFDELKNHANFVKYIKFYCWQHFQWTNQENDSVLIQVTADEKKEFNEMSYMKISNAIVNSLHDIEPTDINCFEVTEKYSLLSISLFNECRDSRRNLQNSLTKFVKSGSLMSSISSIRSNGDVSLFVKLFNMLATCIEVYKWDDQLLTDMLDSFFSTQINEIISYQEQVDVKNNISILKKSLMSLIANRSISMKISNAAPLIQSLFNEIADTESKSYYDLPKMEIILECLMHLSSKHKWSLKLIGGKSFLSELFLWLSQILVSFHVDRIGASLTFMGKGIVKKAVFSMCHVMHEIKAIDSDMSWLANTYSENSSTENLTQSSQTKSNMQWLIPLFSDRLTDIRWCGWALSTALISDHMSRDIVIQEFQNFPGGIWASCVSSILDDKECSLIRSQACLLLCELLNIHPCENVATEHSIWDSMVVEDTATKNEINGIEGFYLLLDHFNFYGHAKYLLAQNNKNNSNTPSKLIDVSTSVTPTNEEFSSFGNTSYKESSTSRQQTFDASRTQDTVARHFQYAFVNLLFFIFKLPGSKAVNKLRDSGAWNTLFSEDGHVSTMELLRSNDKDVLLDHEASNSNELNKQVNICRDEILLITAKIKLLIYLLNDDSDEVIAKEMKHFLEFLFRLFMFHDKDIKWKEELVDLWYHLSLFNTKLVSLNQFDGAIELFLRKDIFSSIVGILLELTNRLKSYEQRLAPSMLKFLLTMLKHIANQKKWHIDDVELAIDIDDLMPRDQHNVSSGEYLLSVLMKMQTKLFSEHLVCMIRCCISCLFASSQKSQTYALTNGVVEISIEEIKDVLVKLKLLQVLDDGSKKRKIGAHLSTLCNMVDFIRNFSYKNNQVKESYILRDIVVHLNNIWSWSNHSERLKISLLQLYVCLCADCKKAQVSFVTSALKISTEENHVCHNMLKQFIHLQEEMLTPVVRKVNPTLRIYFQFIINICGSREARNCFYKLNVLQFFPRIFALRDRGNKHQRHVAKSVLLHWLRFLTVLSYYPDGALAIAKLQGVIELLIELINQSNDSNSYYVILILRNMLFVAALKQLITSNSKLIMKVSEKLFTSQTSMKTKLVTSSFFNIILIENLKAKSLLKKFKIREIFQNTYDNILSGKYLTRSENFDEHDSFKMNVQKVINLLEKD